MSQITLRGMDPEIEREIRRQAKKTGKSINKIILEIISEKTGNKKEKPLAFSLRKLAGGWSNAQAEQFLNSIQSCEQIDEEMWK